MIAALSGLGAGALHVVSGPDHLSALAPLAAREPGRAAKLGAVWGLGHGLGVLAAAGVARLFGALVDLDRLGAYAERAVGVSLILLGLHALWASWRGHPPRPHGGHAGALGFGVLHGAAGAAHLLGALPALWLDRGAAIAYLVAYLIAAVLTMGLAGALVGRGLAERGERARRLAERAGGAIALLVGTYWLLLTPV